VRFLTGRPKLGVGTARVASEWLRAFWPDANGLALTEMVELGNSARSPSGIVPPASPKGPSLSRTGQALAQRCHNHAFQSLTKSGDTNSERPIPMPAL
jgi:hypothetical protein